MITGRPAYLLAQEEYKVLPKAPFSIDFDCIPSLVRQCLGPLGGIQPVTEAIMKATGGVLKDMPCEAEIALFRKAGTQFQSIFVVINLARWHDREGHMAAVPYAITLIPASKRNAVEIKPIDLVAKLDAQKILHDAEPSYAGYDPFTGSWSLFGALSSFLSEKPVQCFPDELGIAWDTIFSRRPSRGWACSKCRLASRIRGRRRNIESTGHVCFMSHSSKSQQDGCGARNHLSNFFSCRNY